MFYHLPMAAPPTPALVLTFEAARRTVEHHASQISAHKTETINLLDSANRILAEPILADRDIPPFPRSTRDGYAVRVSDLSQVPIHVEVIAEIKAGQKPEEIPAAIQPGQTAAIMTGAPVPSGAD